MRIKALITVVLFVLFGSLGFGKSYSENPLLFKPIELNEEYLFDENFDLYNNSYHNNNYVMLNDINTTHFEYNTEKVNAKLFSNFKLIENTYGDYTEYLRGCDNLEDGITNHIKSGVLILSMIINHFVNNILFEGRGIFFTK